MKKLFFGRKELKGKVVLKELQRAHLVIALLAVSLSFIVMVMSVYPTVLDTFLVSVASALLIIVAAISLSVVFAIQSKK